MIFARLLDLESLDYAAALALMRSLAQARRRPDWPEVLMLTEHEPVLTLGRRAGAQDILVPEELLKAKGVTAYRIERGGLATFHGPGQIMAYPIFSLRAVSLGAASFVARLEEVVISVLKDFGLEGGREAGHPGVWVGPDKIASIGLAVRRGVAFHGLALNHDPDLSFFDLIQPCGLTGVRMTSMARLLGRPVDPGRLRSRMAAEFARAFNLDLASWTLAQARAALKDNDRAIAQAGVA